MTTDEQLLQLVGVKALTEGFSGAQTHLKGLLARQMTVTDRRAVALPLDGQKVKVANVAYKNGRKATTTAAVVDPAAFLAWVQANHPEALEVAVKEWFVAEQLKSAIDRGAAVDINGEEIPGIEVTDKPAGDPYIAVELEPTIEAKAALMSALLDNNAAGVRSLLALPSSPSQTGDSSK